MREMAELARGLGVRLHTHLAETREEDAYCRQTLSRTPAEYADELGWLGEDVWLAHCVHLDEPAVKRFAVTGTSVAHCPTSNARLGAGIAPVRQLLRAGVPVGRPRRRPAWAGPTRSARCGQACWPTSPCGGSTTLHARRHRLRRQARTRRTATQWRRWSSGRPHRSSCSWSAAGP